MCSYNSINGTPACLHGDFQNTIARGQWGFNGLIVSDQDSIECAFQDHHYGGSQANVSALGECESL
jgi:beta-glucosidase-like glycosyl hydrolase